jgi:uncharacterized membrane protein YhaH (DUF805 family)
MFCGVCGTKSGEYSTQNIQGNQIANMSFGSAYLSFWKKYADFNGRARRMEVWSVFVFGALIGITISIIDMVAETPVLLDLGDDFSNWRLFFILYNFAILIPSLSISVRRLHDIGKSGWNILWGITIIGLIPLYIWLYFIDSQVDENEYGTNPKGLNF